MTPRKANPDMSTDTPDNDDQAEYVDLETLFEPRLPEDDVTFTLKGKKVKVRVRALNRLEVLHVQNVDRDREDRGAEIDRRMLSIGVLKPALTPATAGKWMAASPGGELEPVTDRIAELSGLRADSAKEAVKEFEADPEAEFPVSSGT
jgi:hypothetical protein